MEIPPPTTPKWWKMLECYCEVSAKCSGVRFEYLFEDISGRNEVASPA